MIMRCNCEHEFQDSTHGPHMRVHNKIDKPLTYRCTVCGQENKSGREKAKDGK